MGALGVRNFSGGSPGLLTLPSYIGLDYPMSNFYLACAGAAIAFVVSFGVSYVLYKDPVEEAAGNSGFGAGAAAPQGSGSKGSGSEGNVSEGGSGQKSAASDNGTHNTGAQANAGGDVVLAAPLKGKHFEAKVKSGDKVKKGQLLLKFDIDGIVKEGYEVITSIIISNTPNYSAVNLVKTGDVAVGEQWLELKGGKA